VPIIAIDDADAAQRAAPRGWNAPGATPSVVASLPEGAAMLSLMADYISKSDAYSGGCNAVLHARRGFSTKARSSHDLIQL